MVHNEIHAIDLAIIAAYLIAMVLIGLVVVKKVKSMDDYYLGGRSFGPLVLMATVCATIIGGSGLMGRAGVAYSSGFKAIMTALPYLLGMFIFSGFAGRISDVGRKFNVTSIPDLFEQRFGKTAKVVLGCLIAFTMMGTVASQVTATATIINMLGGEIGISYEMGALIACAVFIIYTATSGLFGVIYTDVFQFVMLILFVYILIPTSSLIKLGGIGNFVQNLAPELAKPYIDGGIVGDIITYFVFTLAGAEMWQRAFAARNRKSAKEGLFLGTLVYGLTIPLVFLIYTLLQRRKVLPCLQFTMETWTALSTIRLSFSTTFTRPSGSKTLSPKRSSRQSIAALSWGPMPSKRRSSASSRPKNSQAAQRLCFSCISCPRTSTTPPIAEIIAHGGF